MKPEMLFFQVGALVALLLLFRYAWRLSGLRVALLLFAYLFGVSVARERLVQFLCAFCNVPLPFRSNGALRFAGVHLVVVGGWMFTTLVSWGIARLIQQRNLPGTNRFMTLSLAALVATTIAYTVEVTGMRLHLWIWQQPKIFYVPGLPFDLPWDGFEGWSATVFMIAGIWMALTRKVFSPNPWRHAAIAVVLVAVWSVADLAAQALHFSPRKVLTVAYMLTALYLGLRSPAQEPDAGAEAPAG